MKFEKHLPAPPLWPYIRHYVVSEGTTPNLYKVYPSTGPVIGFQYKGQLSAIADGDERKLDASGVTGIADHYKLFKSSANIGTVLVYFTETGFAHFTAIPVNELFNLSTSLDDIFDKSRIAEVEARLALADTDRLRVAIVEKFLSSHLKDVEADKLIVEAVRLIYERKGNIRIRELNEMLSISASPFEKRFRKVVGTTAKKFSSIVRFNTVMSELGKAKSLTEICYENNFFDQAHFIKDFKQFTGKTPENFKRLL